MADEKMDKILKRTMRKSDGSNAEESPVVKPEFSQRIDALPTETPAQEQDFDKLLAGLESPENKPKTASETKSQTIPDIDETKKFKRQIIPIDSVPKEEPRVMSLESLAGLVEAHSRQLIPFKEQLEKYKEKLDGIEQNLLPVDQRAKTTVDILIDDAGKRIGDERTKITESINSYKSEKQNQDIRIDGIEAKANQRDDDNKNLITTQSKHLSAYSLQMLGFATELLKLADYTGKQKLEVDVNQVNQVFYDKNGAEISASEIDVFDPKTAYKKLVVEFDEKIDADAVSLVYLVIDRRNNKDTTISLDGIVTNRDYGTVVSVMAPNFEQLLKEDNFSTNKGLIISLKGVYAYNNGEIPLEIAKVKRKVKELIPYTFEIQMAKLEAKAEVKEEAEEIRERTSKEIDAQLEETDLKQGYNNPEEKK